MLKHSLILSVIAFAFCKSESSGSPSIIDVCCPSRTLTYSEEWNYFKVRPNANLFYWLYYEESTTGNQKIDSSRPLFIWLQGGPGASSTGFGNFQEIGPLDVNLKPRDTTWLSRGDLLFVDSPVGTGYSYVTDNSAYTENVDEIAKDLVDFTIDFMANHTEYKDRPFYIVCESYGGKVSAVYAWQLYSAIQQGKIKMNFRGVGLGDSWISPIDFVDTWPDYLYYFSRLSTNGLSKAKDQAGKCDKNVENGEWLKATSCWETMESVVGQLSGDVSWYNVMKNSGEDPWSRMSTKSNMMLNQMNDELDKLMNGLMRQKLGIIPKDVSWGGQSGMVFSKQSVDFMKPVIDTVDQLLNATNLTVFIYNGQFDLICDTAGVELWMNRLKWPSLKTFQATERKEVHDKFGKKEIVAYLQNYKNLYFYWILKAGHMVPADAPTASLTMLDMITAL
jgi:serine carboxypeptidase 1